MKRLLDLDELAAYFTPFTFFLPPCFETLVDASKFFSIPAEKFNIILYSVIPDNELILFVKKPNPDFLVHFSD